MVQGVKMMMKRIQQVKFVAGALALNSFVAICVRVGDAIYVSQALAGTTPIADAANFVLDYWAVQVFFWSSLVCFICVQAEKVNNKLKSLF